jgi:L-fuculose-phosphate aldolase
MTEATLRAALVEAGRASVACGLNHGASGNLSLRAGAAFLVTPTGLPCDGFTADDAVSVSLADGSATGRLAPSSEWRLHRDLYLARSDIGAIVHAHPRFSTTIACLREDLPPVHYMLAVTGGDRVRCSGYATYGTEALSRAAVAAMGSSRACLLANHGLVACGADLTEALRVAAEVETVAEYWWRARAIGTPVLLTAEEMAEALERFKSYGQQRGT